ncbi:hypothetical protein [Aestuariivirga sp.]|uniref:hypothetical protein n=1 Tax=Aestuariivirga sp. TaxID=2650926 RepID=UPI003BA8D738
MKRLWVDLSGIVLSTAAIAALYVAASAIVYLVFRPLQAIFLPGISDYASLIFLPHGVRVFATIVLRSRAIPGLFLGALVSNSLLWGVTDPAILISQAVIAGATSWLVFEALYALRINPYYLSSTAQVPPLHTILLAGLFCSFANGFLMTAVLEHTTEVQHITLTMATFSVGDMIGLMVSWVITFIGLKFFTELSK